MNNALREAEILVRVQAYPIEASELVRRGKLKDAIRLLAELASMSEELKMLLARRCQGLR